jgi:hypothetical protein
MEISEKITELAAKIVFKPITPNATACKRINTGFKCIRFTL